MTLYICPIHHKSIRKHTRKELLTCSEDAMLYVAHLQFLRLMYPDNPLWETKEADG